ncbi:MAG TPA: hypothetical protein VL084_00020 [Thermoanaerobaculia bacterium]|nr:hypothetical protein [Thermoanaerobaculia bacterium]
MRQRVETAPEALPTHPGVDGHHRCTECPVCGTEECSVLQDLGMSCDTAQAAQEAKGIRWGVRRVSDAPGRAARAARR